MPVCIAGMHRSGTSMVAHLLHVCGLYLGPEANLFQPDVNNLDGYWENLKFVDLNDEILNALDAGWDYWPSLAYGWEQEEKFAPLRARAVELLKELAGHEHWGWKDPRNSLTLPLWRSVIPEAKVVVCVRNPLEVALSLHRRNQFSYAHSFALWKVHNLRVLDLVPREEQIITHYDAFFSDPKAELRRLLDFIGLDASEELIERSCSTVRADLRHNRFTHEHLLTSDVPPDVLDLYARMCEEAGWSEHAEPGRAARDLKPADKHEQKDERTRGAGSHSAGVQEESGTAELTSGELRRIVAEQGERLNTLSTQLQELSLREDDLRDLLYDTRQQFEYQWIVRRVVGKVRETVEPGAVALVVSRGDEDLLDLGGLSGWHFPQTEEGWYAGEYPEYDNAVIAHLETLRAKGAEFLVFPKTAFWWLDHYAEFGKHVAGRYRVVYDDEETCKIFDLRSQPEKRAEPGAASRFLAGALNGVSGRLRRAKGARRRHRATPVRLVEGD